MADGSYLLIQFETFADALASAAQLRDLAANCDQLNVVVREEGDMDRHEILSLAPQIKLFAGAAWYLIHERRRVEGWYDTQQYFAGAAVSRRAPSRRRSKRSR